MKKIYLLHCLLVSCTFVAAAQKASSFRPASVKRHISTLYRPTPPAAPFLEYEVPVQTNPPVLYQSGVHYRNMEEPAGATTWDAQTYGCTQRRLYANNKGEPVINWLYSNEQAGFSDRGTANSTRDATTGWEEATKRVESVRTGFPAADRLSDGTEVIVAHATAPTPNRIHCTRRRPGAANWIDTDLPVPTGQSCLWPQIAIGGQDGKTIHVIAITTPTGNSGKIYRGVNGHVLYWRSRDGGDTWDIRHTIIPGCDSTLSTAVGATNYAIDAEGDYVAVSVFNSLGWQDMPVFKSADNGNTWESMLIRDFPDFLENYDPQPGDPLYTEDDIGGADPDAPNPLAIMTNDGHGTLLIDSKGEVHAWFGAAYVVDLNDADSSWSYYPTVNQLRYWKESFGENVSTIITGALDYDGDEALGLATLEELAPYSNASLASMPQAGIDKNGVLFLTYTAIHELYRTGTGDENDEFYRHVYVMRSDDNGNTWSQPLDINNVPYVEDFVVPTLEGVNPVIPRHVGESVWIAYAQDQTPGSNVAGNHHPVTLTYIMWLDVNRDSIPKVIVGTHEVNKLPFRIAPNPVQSMAGIQVETTDLSPLQLMIFDLTGKCVQSNVLNPGAGVQNLSLPVAHLTPGVYTVRIKQGNRTGAAKLVKLNQP